MLQREVVVIGAGVGGLACAIDLARQGVKVVVVERAQTPGGKIREVVAGSTAMDAGPTVFTMRWVFEALFADAGSSLERHVGLTPAEVLARHAWADGARLDLFADPQQSTDAVGAFAGAAEAKGYAAFRREGARIFATLRDSFLNAEKTGPVGLARNVGLLRLGDLMAIRPFETLWDALGRHFQNPRLRQLFGRYATYCGSSPFTAPATLMLIAHVEQEGVWLVRGGMKRLAEALAALAVSVGVEFRYGADAERIVLRNGHAAGVDLVGGEHVRADGVVTNADFRALFSGALGQDCASRRALARAGPRSLSAITWSLEATTSGFPLSRHNVFFSEDYPREFHELFGLRRLASAPTIYVCAQDRDDQGFGASGPERLLVLINAPPNGDLGPIDQTELSLCQDQVFQHLARCGLAVGRGLETAVATTPRDFHRLFPASGGALYGAATHGWAAAFRRPGPMTPTKGVYQTGGGAHPGAGVPMAALSGRLTAARVLKDLALTSPSPRAAIGGGTLTRSATMGDSA